MNRFALLLLTLLCIACSDSAPPRGVDAFADPGDPTDLPWPLPPPPPISIGLPIDVIVPSEPVGYLEGSSAVTPSGELTYTIPLEVPAGRAGMQPGLALSYSSHNGNGLAGVGWSVEGFSEIRRCGKTLSTEGEVDGVDFDATGSASTGRSSSP